ncbi:hypothetical protein NZD89_22685 [Alicyclobacillus fastidiosus]|uniref:Uncharacterized protein n=2 Tax=Alicyclobacillus fastidiosus TaxID=392011 RepID=A0ABY6ZDU3_9BACL|nr:hypothetical protein [Alicyclobacillus fastidiosus]WAH41059.1 hypothetical protein NZD89_22685 [Alicyclobacillus fastidiosus]GMA62591.1 hypothetical protein GCM10025859_30310 [Alicyclobacillus fastidiosus]
MQWSEVREMFPDKFLLLEDLKSHIENGELHIEEVAVIRPLKDGKEAMDELMRAHNKVFVYHTKHEHISMPVRPKPAYRGYMQ